MTEPEQIGQGPLGRLAKIAAPRLSGIVPVKAARLLGLYSDVLQGKGSGTGWDIAREAHSDAAALNGVSQPVIADAGANQGQWALAMSRVLTGRNPKFLLFEPQSTCQEALSLLAIPDCTVVHAALGDTPGKALLHADAAGSGIASLYERHDTYFGNMDAYQEMVEVVTLDEVLREYGVERLDLLKLDMEGSELAALRGAQESLASGIVRAVAFEFGSADIYSRCFFRDFWELLTGYGFTLARVRPGGRLLEISAYSEEHEHFRGVSNYLARL
jgi:FkbM family methyltransferase